MDHCARKKLAKSLIRNLSSLDVMLVGLPAIGIKDYLIRARIEITRLMTFTGYQLAANGDYHGRSPKLEIRSRKEWVYTLLEYVETGSPSLIEAVVADTDGPLATEEREDWLHSRRADRFIDRLTDLLLSDERWIRNFPAKAGLRPLKFKVLIEVEGGSVSAVHASPCGGVEVVVLDHDNGKVEESAMDVWFADGQTAAKFLEQVRINPEHYESIR